VGREKFLKFDFFNYMKIKNHKKWESKNKTKLEKGKKRHNIRRILYFLELFLSSKAMWVAIDCRSKNWVAVLKSFGSTVVMQ
jgi:hypothetical protein